MKRVLTLFFFSFVLTACQSSPTPVDRTGVPATASQNTKTVKSNSNQTNQDPHQSNQSKSAKKSKSDPKNQQASLSSISPSQSHSVSKSGLSAPSDLVPVVVSKETDGDTLYVKMPDGSEEKIRLLLIDTPEDVDYRKPVEPFSLKAAAFARDKLPIGKHVFLEEGKPGYKRGKYGRLLAYVWINKHDMYNADVVKKGLARVAYVYPPNTDHLSLLKKKQHYAKNHDLGIWSISNYVTHDGYNLTIACRWADQHGYSDRGCPSDSGSSGQTSLKVVSSNLNVSPGQYASVTVKTTPGATGSIEVDYKSGSSNAQGLDPKTADNSGKITWQWKVGTRTTPGDWPVKITVGGHTITKYLHVQ